MPSWLDKIFNRYRQNKLTTPERTLNTFKNGVREVDEGHPEKAIILFTEAMKSAPNSSKLHHYRADAYALNDEHESAIFDYDIAVRLNPSYPDTYLDRGNSHYQLNQYDSALKDFSEAIRLKPEWGEAYANRAVINLELGNEDESKADAETAKSLGVDEAQLIEMLETSNTELEANE
jgi:tetratricopeptide (TPR) repeat protein